jgi:predicted DNA-binding transcriptional regulator AlpA
MQALVPLAIDCNCSGTSMTPDRSVNPGTAKTRPQLAIAKKALALKRRKAKFALSAALVTANNEHQVEQGHADDVDHARHNRQNEHGARAPPVLLLNKAKILAITGVSFPTIWAWMRARPPKFPRGREMGGKTVWRSDEVQAWIDGLPIRRLKGDVDSTEASA